MRRPGDASRTASAAARSPSAAKRTSRSQRRRRHRPRAGTRSAAAAPGTANSALRSLGHSRIQSTPKRVELGSRRRLGTWRSAPDRSRRTRAGADGSGSTARDAAFDTESPSHSRHRPAASAAPGAARSSAAGDPSNRAGLTGDLDFPRQEPRCEQKRPEQGGQDDQRPQQHGTARGLTRTAARRSSEPSRALYGHTRNASA